MTIATEHIFVDNLRVGRLVRFVLSWLVKGASSGPARDLFVIYRISRGAWVLAKLLRALGVRISVHEMEFDLVDDVRVPGIPSTIEYIYFRAIPELVGRIASNPDYDLPIRKLALKPCHEEYLRAYVSKHLFFELREPVSSILIAVWYSRTKLGNACVRPILYLGKSWFFDLLPEFASRWNIQLHRAPGMSVAWRSIAHRLYRFLNLYGFLKRARFWVLRLGSEKSSQGGIHLDGMPSVRIAAEMYLNGIRREPIYNTEFFWYRKPNLPQGAVFGYFALPSDQPNESRVGWLKDAGIAWVDRATLGRLMHATRQQDSRMKVNPTRGLHVLEPGRSEVQRAVCRYIKDFYSDYEGWIRFFNATGARIHVSTYDVFPRSEALHAALADNGGISISVQRSIEREPYPLRRTVTDVHFAFSKAQAELERLSGSSIKQFVTSGYIFDDAFGAAKLYGKKFSSQLRLQGVTFILCFFDGNHGVIRKTIGGRRLTQEDYAFLCNRLEADETLGLVIKPKRSDTLPERLGPVWPRLERLIDSGRCILLAGQMPDQRYLPCVGACAADLAIGLLSGGTAGLESYLAGTRTLLLRHGPELGVFEHLPRGGVVFETWDELWKAVELFRADSSDQEIGNWEPVIEQLASLRDGRASERIGSYIAWLYEAFTAGKSREEALIYAGSLYSATWGSDLIARIHQPTAGDSNFCQEKPLSNEETVQSFAEVNR